MIRPTLRHLVLAMVAVPLALGLAACSKKGGGSGEKPTGEPIAKVAPPAGKTWTEVVSKTPQDGYRMGNPDAPIKLVEFGSLTCPHCAHFAEESGKELRDTFVDSGRVSYEFRNFVRDPIDITAAQLTRCGTPQSFFPLTEQVFANQTAMIQKVEKAGNAAYRAAVTAPPAKRGIALGQITGLVDFFAARGIPKDQSHACLANSAEAKKLADETSKQGDKYDIQGTPTFLINGEKVDINTWPEIRARLENLGAR